MLLRVGWGGGGVIEGGGATTLTHVYARYVRSHVCARVRVEQIMCVHM